MIFVPVTDYSDNAIEAERITSLDLGFINAGESKSVSFRVGNTSEYSLSVVLSSDNPAVALSVTTITLDDAEISDTVTATVSVPVDCQTTPETAYLTAGGSELVLTWQTIGANVDRVQQYPDRTADFTDNVTSVLDRVGEVLRVYTFDPIAYDETDTRIYVVPAGRFKSQRDICCRLDPLDDRWGFTRSVQTVVGSFQNESWEQTEQFTRDNSSVNYSGGATLYLPAEFELIRQWALFANANPPDRAQYKRTVFLIQRQGVVWDLRTIIPIYRGQQLAYWHCNLIPLTQNTMGSPAGYNPFAFSYEYESDKPYAQFSCQTDIRFAEQLSADPYMPITEPVALSLGDVSAYVLRNTGENVKVVNLCVTDISSWDHVSHTLSDSETWGVNQCNIKSVYVDTDYVGEWILAFLPTSSITCYNDLFTQFGNCEGTNIFRTGSLTAWVDFPYSDSTNSRSVHIWFSGVLRNEAGNIIGYPEAIANKIFIHAIA